MALSIGMVTIDCVDPRGLAKFWTAALGTEVMMDMDGAFLMLAPSSDGGPAVALQQVPEPRTGKNRVHIDLRADDREREIERLTALGATVVDEQVVPGLTWTVLTDPEDNVFCVGQYA
ncbi:MAG: VOC family protein [Streptosporangiales bacterium]|nr:VOC family protein [Streptosporangiales bacterium]